MCPSAVDLLVEMLQLLPDSRIKACDLVRHPYISPQPTSKSTEGTLTCPTDVREALGLKEAPPAQQVGLTTQVGPIARGMRFRTKRSAWPHKCRCGYSCGNEAKTHKMSKVAYTRKTRGEKVRPQDLFPCQASAVPGTNLCTHCTCTQCGKYVRNKGPTCATCKALREEPAPDSVWHYVRKFQDSLAHMLPRDVVAFVAEGPEAETCCNVVEALLWEPIGVKACAERWGDQGPAPGPAKVRAAVMAAVQACHKARQEGSEVYSEDLEVLSADKMGRLLGVARTAQRLGVIVEEASQSQDKPDYPVYVLGRQGKQYREVSGNKILEDFWAAFAMPWQCDAEMSGLEVRRGVQALQAKYRLCPLRWRCLLATCTSTACASIS